MVRPLVIDTEAQPGRLPIDSDARPSPPYAAVMMGKRLSAVIGIDRATQTEQEETAVIHPSDTGISRPSAVRAGQGAPVTCVACGCRLAPTGEAWFHFNPIAGRDARGCRIGCADAAHDASGHLIAVAV